MTLGGDTIFARASGAGKAGVAVFRLSGPSAKAAAETLSGVSLAARRAHYAVVRDPKSQSPIDSGLILYFPAPNSFTGEDVVELQLHGARAVEIDLYRTLTAMGLRLAEPGEFTKRALQNGQMDLAEVEGLADLVDAETSFQRRQALAQQFGGLSKVAADWRARLIAILAALEADIDFPDEEDVPAAVAAGAGPEIAALIDDLSAHRKRSKGAQSLRDGVYAAIIGPPNAGKSSLLNLLAGDDKAIVSTTPGTTRDAIEVRMDLAGAPVTFVDTAGLRDQTDDEIEIQGMGRTRNAAQSAHLRILVIDLFADVSRETLSLAQAGDFVLVNKTDLADATARAEAVARRLGRLGVADRLVGMGVSVATGAGIDGFVDALTERVRALSATDLEGPLTRERHVAAVSEAIERLGQASSKVETAAELAAEDVRLAARALARITGDVDVEAVLGDIFSSFCIGK